jgi:internalin A
MRICSGRKADVKKCILVPIIAILTAFLFAACGNKNEPVPAPEPAPAYETITIRGEEYCTSLTELCLKGLKLTCEEIIPLEKMTNLTALYLHSNEISDLTPLSGLINLTELELGNNRISDLSPLSGLTGINRELNLQRNQISDLTPLSNLTNVRSMNLGSNQITDITPLAGLIYTHTLRLSYNQVSDLSPLAGLTNLRILTIYNNDVTDITPLIGLSLSELGASSNQIEDFSMLAEMPSLTWFRWGDNPVSDEQIEELQLALPHCRIMPEWNWQTTSYAIIALRASVGFFTPYESEIDFFDMDGDGVLTTKDALMQLRRSVGLPPDPDFIVIRGEKYSVYLTELDLSGHALVTRDISWLEYFTNLTWLNLGGVQIADLSPLAGMTDLRTLYLQNNMISDITPLKQLTNLEVLDLSNNRINSNQIAELQEALPNCEIIIN